MRVLLIDIDTLRPDHLGCYGYERNTSPVMDEVAAGGVRFDNVYASDVPCLPSRAAFYHSRFGIHTGVVNHGGTEADLRLEGASRGFRTAPEASTWPQVLKEKGIRTVSVSPFAERHGAWWFLQGWREQYNPGKGGMESAEEVCPWALDWLEQNAEKDDWLLHVNMWDPHTPYRAPADFGDPFAEAPAPAWLTKEMLAAHRQTFGPHSAREPWGLKPPTEEMLKRYPRVPAEITGLDDFKRWTAGYDTGVRYADLWVGRLLETLKRKGLYEDTAVIITSDHGENLGELNVYGDHQTADLCTNRIPLIVKWPGLQGGRVDRALHYQLDFAPTLMELLEARVPKKWDGESFAAALKAGEEKGRDFLVLSQCAWSCQRAVRWDNRLLVRTYHDGLKDFPELMLFDAEKDPHETVNLAADEPEAVGHGLRLLDRWHAEMMRSSPSAEDPLWHVIGEGGPFHVRRGLAEVKAYPQRLRETGREAHTARVERGDGVPRPL